MQSRTQNFFKGGGGCFQIGCNVTARGGEAIEQERVLEGVTY